MKDKTQANHLVKIMKKHKLYPEYELALFPVEVKKNSLNKLSTGDIFLLGLDSLNMVLLEEGRICAGIVIDKSEHSSKLRIMQLHEGRIKQPQAKKYKTVTISFGKIQSRKLEVGHTIGATSLNLRKVKISIENKIVAKGSLVTVDEEIAVQINEVI